jgi:hypothetical protein
MTNGMAPSGPALRAGSQHSAHPGLPLRGPGHGGHAFGSPHLCSVTSPSPCPRHGPTLTVPSHVPPRITSPSDAWPLSRCIGHAPLLTPGGQSQMVPRPGHGSRSRPPIAHAWWPRSHFILTSPWSRAHNPCAAGVRLLTTHDAMRLGS